MIHGLNVGFWKEYTDGIVALMEKRGYKFTSFEEMMEQESEEEPWEIYDYTPEDYYYNVTLGDEMYYAYQDTIKNFWDTACFAAELTLSGSAYDVKIDDAKRCISILEAGKTIVTIVVKDVEDITITMPDYIYNTIKVYPEILEQGRVKSGIVEIDGVVLDNTTQAMMIIAGRAKELVDSCD